MTDTNPIKIAVLQRGFCVVGRFARDGEHCTLTDASMIRRWGTTKGLGEIAEGGPTATTVLDPCPPVEYHELTAIMHIACVEEKWASRLR